MKYSFQLLSGEHQIIFPKIKEHIFFFSKIQVKLFSCAHQIVTEFFSKNVSKKISKNWSQEDDVFWLLFDAHKMVTDFFPQI